MTTARYTRVATGIISKIESPLDGLSGPRRKRVRRDTEEPDAVAPGPWLDQLWRSRTSSAITVLLDVTPTAGISASTN